MINRIKGVLSLDQSAFSEVEHDEGATGQAAIIVIIASILSALGASSDRFMGAFATGNSPLDLSFGSGSPLLLLLGIAIWSILGWIVWAGVTYFVGAKIFSGEATYGEMLRVTGFGYAPVAFMILGVIPCIGFAISLLVLVWALAAVFVGVREGLDLGFGRTLATVLIGWLLYLIGMAVIGGIFNLF